MRSSFPSLVEARRESDSSDVGLPLKDQVKLAAKQLQKVLLDT